MQRLIWSLASLRDLRGIEAFVGAEDPRAALRIIQAIRNRAEQLRRFPASGPALSDDLRFLTIRSTPFVVIYRMGRGRIEMLRVRHVRENWRPE